MNTDTLYHQYRRYFQAENSGWQLGEDGRRLRSGTRQRQLKLEMCVDGFGAGLILSRMRGTGEGAFATQAQGISHNCALFVVLAGRHRLRAHGREYRPAAGDVWLVRGSMDDTAETLTPDHNGIAALHLDFSLERLRRWHDEGLLGGSLFSPQNIGSFALEKIGSRIPALAAPARNLLGRSFDGGSLNLLETESAALELTAQLLRFNLTRCERPYLRRRIDEAADILRCEFAQNHTIAALARRVGLNECYLKRYFKAQTGHTIAAYLRKIRLEHAREMLECGHNISQAMQQAGYRHAGHFNQAFRRHFGCLPSEMKKGA